MPKTHEERLWDWLNAFLVDGFVAYKTPRQVYDYIVKNWQPKKKVKSL